MDTWNKLCPTSQGTEHHCPALQHCPNPAPAFRIPPSPVLPGTPAGTGAVPSAASAGSEMALSSPLQGTEVLASLSPSPAPVTAPCFIPTPWAASWSSPFAYAARVVLYLELAFLHRSEIYPERCLVQLSGWSRLPSALAAGRKSSVLALCSGGFPVSGMPGHCRAARLWEVVSLLRTHQQGKSLKKQ